MLPWALTHPGTTQGLLHKQEDHEMCIVVFDACIWITWTERDEIVFVLPTYSGSVDERIRGIKRVYNAV